MNFWMKCSRRKCFLAENAVAQRRRENQGRFCFFGIHLFRLFLRASAPLRPPREKVVGCSPWLRSLSCVLFFCLVSAQVAHAVETTPPDTGEDRGGLTVPAGSARLANNGLVEPGTSGKTPEVVPRSSTAHHCQ